MNPQQIDVLYFGEIADEIGLTKEAIEVNELSVAALLRAVEAKHNLNTSSFQIAINHQLVSSSDEHGFNATDEIALLSAFSGG